MTIGPRDVIVIGAGGHCKVVLDVLRATGWQPAGILDPSPSRPEVLGIPVLGGDEMATELRDRGYKRAIVAIGKNSLRRQIAQLLVETGFDLVTAVHPAAVVSPSADLGQGVVVMPNAVINADARIGAVAIVNTAAIVEHDCVLGEATHVAPRSVLGGNVVLGEEVVFGIGATARPMSRVGDRTVVGAGAVVIGELGSDLVVTGVPARPLAGTAGSSGGGRP
jgi:UDP-perosamine 4-acetyltransferase